MGLTACAGRHPVHPEPLDSGDSALRTLKQPPAPQANAVYLMLSAELAGQRGQYDTALQQYLEAARLTHDPQIAERATQIALYLKNTDKALEAASLWVEHAPRNASARRISALLLFKSGQSDLAVEQFKGLLSLPDVDLENTLIELVRWLNAEVSQDNGLSVFRRLIAAFPSMAEMHFAYALYASDKGEHQLALDETEQALALHPDWSRARLLQAQVMAQMGDSAAARDAVQRALKSDPGNARLRLIYAQFLGRTGDSKGAEREFQRLLQKDPANYDARFGLAIIRMDSGQTERARQDLLGLVGVEKWQAQAQYYLGLIEARAQRPENALQWFEKIQSGPLEFDARVNAISALIQLGRTDEARGRLGEARKANPKEALRLYLLEAELLSKAKRHEQAFDLLTEAMEALPGQVELIYARALMAEQLGRIEILEADLRGILEKNPDDANALNALGYTLASQTERLEEAKRYIERALELKPDDPAILDSFGWVQYRLGNYEVALDYLRRAYKKVPDPEIGSHLGEVLWESGNQQEAKRIWKEALKKDPEHEDMKDVMQRYREAFE